MDTSEILKSLEDPEPVPEQPKIQLDLTQLQGALILIQDNLATQQKMIAELVKTTNSINDSSLNGHRNINAKVDALPNKLNDTYSEAVLVLTRTINEKLDIDNRMTTSMISAKDALINIQADLKSEANKVSKAANDVGDILDNTNKIARKLSLDQYLHYIFIAVFSIWLAYARFTDWGNSFMMYSTGAIMIGFIFLRFV